VARLWQPRFLLSLGLALTEEALGGIPSPPQAEPEAGAEVEAAQQCSPAPEMLAQWQAH